MALVREGKEDVRVGEVKGEGSGRGEVGTPLCGVKKKKN